MSPAFITNTNDTCLVCCRNSKKQWCLSQLVSGSLNASALSPSIGDAGPTRAPSYSRPTSDRRASLADLIVSRPVNKKRPKTTNVKASPQSYGIKALALQSVAANHLSSSWQPCEVQRRLAALYEFVHRTAGGAVCSPDEFSADYTCVLTDKLLQHYLTDDVEHLAEFLGHLTGPVELTIRLVILVNTRLDLNIGPYYGCTPLGYAILRDDVTLATTLLKHGADPIAAPCIPSLPVTADIRSSMHLALSHHTSAQLVDLLLRDHPEAMADINHDDFWSSFILYVAKCNDVTTMTSLLTFADDIDRTDSSSCTALQHAARAGNHVACEALVRHGADVNMCDRARKTALMCATEADADAVVELLLAGGADVHATDAWGRTSLHYAARKSVVATVRRLLAAGAHVGVLDNRGLSPLHYAFADADNRKLLGRAAPKDDEAVLLECLLSHDAGQVSFIPRLTATDFIGIAQLLFSSSESQAAIDKLLKDNVKYVSACAGNGQTVLHLAARHGNAESVRWLLEHGAQASDADSKGWTALHCAAVGGDVDVVDQLLDQRLVDIDQATRDGWTPLWLAVRCRHAQVAARFVSAGCHVTKTMSINRLRGGLDVDVTLPTWEGEEQDNTRESTRRGRRRISLIELTIHFRLYGLACLLHTAGARPYVPARQDDQSSPCDDLRLLVENKLSVETQLGDAASVEYLTLLADALFQCRGLKDTCRVVIRQALNTDIGERARQLPLPPVLVNYVQLRDLPLLPSSQANRQQDPAIWV